MPVNITSESNNMLSIPEGYSPVQLDTLCPESVMGFDLYLITDMSTKPVLYCNHDVPFSIDRREKLVESDVTTMYIATTDSLSYQRYLEDNIGDLLNASYITTQHKTKVLYGCAQNMLESMYTTPGASDMMKRSHALVSEISEFVFRDEDAFPTFLETCAFDYAVYSHSVNVFMYSIAFAQRLGFRDMEWLNRFGTGTLLHDIGKSRIDPEILHCNGSLSDEQWDIMRMHPVWGWEILKGQGVSDEVILNITRSHHEKLTGNGYPDNLPAEEIPDYVRIVTICDIFDALTTKRSYKDAEGSFSSLKLMHEEMVGEIDPDMYKIFVKLMASQ